MKELGLKIRYIDFCDEFEVLQNLGVFDKRKTYSDKCSVPFVLIYYQTFILNVCTLLHISLGHKQF